MAEYVRRRRPPADHPYWNRMHDRAHPPRVVLSIALAAILGAAFGLYGGLNSEFTVAQATNLAAIIASAAAAVGMAVFLPYWIVDSAYRAVRYEPIVTILAGSAAIAIFVFLVAFVPLVVILIAYSICSGQGPWLGTCMGLMFTMAPTVPIVWGQRMNWLKRQQAWPRWDRMRMPRRRAPSNAGTEVALQVAKTGAIEPAAGTENPSATPAAPENVDV